MKDNLVQSVDRALTILEEVASSEVEVGVTELANKLDLHKSTVHRMLNTLMHKGYIEQNPETEGYKVGLKVFELGSKMFNELEIRDQSLYLKELMQETNETVHLVVRDGDQGVYIDKVDTKQTLRMYSKIGRRVPLYCSAVGKVLLSNLSQDKLEKLYKGVEFKRYTKNTITNWDDFLKELKKVRQNGYAVDNEEHEEEIRCIAAPIKNYKGQIIAAISISGPVFRITDKKVNEFAFKVKNKALMISKRLGYMELA